MLINGLNSDQSFTDIDKKLFSLEVKKLKTRI
jgi:hypothetical protein